MKESLANLLRGYLGGVAGGPGFIYRNVWLDLTWSWLICPSFLKRTFHEAVEALPNESRMMIGGDNWHAEESYGARFFGIRGPLGEL